MSVKKSDLRNNLAFSGAKSLLVTLIDASIAMLYRMLFLPVCT